MGPDWHSGQELCQTGAAALLESSPLLRERVATEFPIISHEEVPVGKGGSGPGEFIFK